MLQRVAACCSVLGVLPSLDKRNRLNTIVILERKLNAKRQLLRPLVIDGHGTVLRIDSCRYSGFIIYGLGFRFSAYT